MKDARGLAVGCLCSARVGSYAQSSLALYGLVYTGVELVTDANASGDKLVGMPGIPGSLPSLWGIRGNEDLGGGYQAVFALESGFNPRAGDIGQGGRLFGRQAWVGLTGRFGTLSFSRQYTVTYQPLLGNDVLGSDAFGIDSLEAYLPNARADNSALYKKKIAGFTIGGKYSFGRDPAGTSNSFDQGTCAISVAGGGRQCTDWSARIKCDGASFGAYVAYEEQHGSTSAAYNFFDGVTPAALTGSVGQDNRLTANAYVRMVRGRIDGGRASCGHVKRSAADSRGSLLPWHLIFPDTVFVLDGEAYRIVNARLGTQGTKGTLRGNCFLSKRTSIYGPAAFLANSVHAGYVVSSDGAGATPGASQKSNWRDGWHCAPVLRNTRSWTNL